MALHLLDTERLPENRSLGITSIDAHSMTPMGSQTLGHGCHPKASLLVHLGYSSPLVSETLDLNQCL